MKQESLDKATEAIVMALTNLEDIDKVDNMEILINIKTLLNNVDSYRENISILQEKQYLKKFRR